MTKQLAKLALLICTLSAVSFGAVAKGDCHHPRGEHHKDNMRLIMSKLDLSAEQKQQVKELRQAKKEQMQALMATQNDRNETRDQLSALIEAETFDEQAFMLLQKEKAKQRAQKGLIAAKSMHQIFQILTAQQKQKYVELKKSHMKKRMEKRMEKQHDRKDKMKHHKQQRANQKDQSEH